MRPIKKPGPKSKTRIKSQARKLPVADLGDVDTEASSHEESFQSPPPDANITDYNLDFTNQTPQIVHSRRKSPRAPTTAPSAARTTAAVLPTIASTSRNVRKTDSVKVVAPPPKRKSRKQTFPQRRELRRILSNTAFMIPRLSFARVVREIMFRECREVCMITRDALEALQTATEKYMESRFEDAYFITLHTGRVTLFVRDMELVNYLLSRFNSI